MSWFEDAACKDVDLDELFGTWQQQADIARTVCVTCPVRVPCAEQGTREAYGLFGGLPEGSPGRRAGAATRSRPTPKPAKPKPAPKVDVDQVLVEEAAAFGLSVEDLTGRSRKPAVVDARWRAMARLYEGGWSTPAIGRVFGRDHTTVLHGMRKVQGWAA